MQPSAPEQKRSFQFVDASDSKLLFRVRSHVSRQSWREWRSSRIASKKNPSAPTTRIASKALIALDCVSAGSDSLQNRQLNSHPLHNDESSESESHYGDDIDLEQLPKMSHEVFWLRTAASALDPFGTSPVSIGAVEEGLIHHYLKVSGPMMFGCPVNSLISPHRAVWIPYALTNMATFNSTLAYAAYHKVYVSGEPDSARPLQYQMAAIRWINERLGDPELAVTDETIIAVARQVNLEDRWGCQEAAQIHRNGLQKMIRIRGGVSAFGSNWRLQLLLLWYTLTTKWRFWDHVPRFSSHPSLIPISGDSDMLLPGTSHNRDQEMLTFLKRLHALLHQRIKKPGSIFLFPCHTSLYSMLYIPMSDPTCGIYTHVEETCRVSSLLWLASIHTSPGTPSSLSPTTLESTARLLASTEKSWAGKLQILIWVLLRGSGAGIEDPERMWHLAALKESVKSWRLAWLVKLHGILVKALFEAEEEEVVAAQAELEELREIVTSHYASDASEMLGLVMDGGREKRF